MGIMQFDRQALVLGATSLIAPYLLASLVEGGYSGRCVSRRPLTLRTEFRARFEWCPLDAMDRAGWQLPRGTVLFSLLPLHRLPSLLPRLEGASHLVALSSSSIVTKENSADPAERDLAAELTKAEERIKDLSAKGGMQHTILRPTLIYDPGYDANISAIAAFIRRLGFFPIARPGRGLRQPVHAEDVARAMLAAVDNPLARNATLYLPGGEVLSYREMVCRIFAGLGRSPRILALPPILLRSAMLALQPLRKMPYSPALFDRMNQDLVFDGAAAHVALRYNPRPFNPVFENRRNNVE